MTETRLIQNFSGMQAHLIVAPQTATDTLVATLMRLGLAVTSVLPTGETPRLDPGRPRPRARPGGRRRRPAPARDGRKRRRGPAAGAGARSRRGRGAEPAQGPAAVRRHGSPAQADPWRLGLRRPLPHGERARAPPRPRGGGRAPRGAPPRPAPRRQGDPAVMQERGLDDDAAFEALRRDSMRARLPLEQYCEALVRPAPTWRRARAAPPSPSDHSQHEDAHRCRDPATDPA